MKNPHNRHRSPICWIIITTLQIPQKLLSDIQFQGAPIFYENTRYRQVFRGNRYQMFEWHHPLAGACLLHALAGNWDSYPGTSVMLNVNIAGQKSLYRLFSVALALLMGQWFVFLRSNASLFNIYGKPIDFDALEFGYTLVDLDTFAGCVGSRDYWLELALRMVRFDRRWLLGLVQSDSDFADFERHCGDNSALGNSADRSCLHRVVGDKLGGFAPIYGKVTSSSEKQCQRLDGSVADAGCAPVQAISRHIPRISSDLKLKDTHSHLMSQFQVGLNKGTLWHTHSN